MSNSIKQFYVVGRPLANPKGDEVIIAQGGEMAKVVDVMSDEVMATIEAEYGKIRIVEGTLYATTMPERPLYKPHTARKDWKVKLKLRGLN